MSPSTTPTVTVIVLNWNGLHLLRDCLPTVVAQDYPGLRVLVVDNGSDDGSVEWIRQHYPDPAVELLALEHNLGFGGGQNAGIRHAFTDPDVCYVITLNNDTELQPTFISEMVACARRHSADRLGSIQGQIVGRDDPPRLDATGILISRDLSAVNRGRGELIPQDAMNGAPTKKHESDEEIFGPSASAALYPREALEQTALQSGDYFDARYFLYYEDVDLAWRLRLAGFTSWYTPLARASHQHSATTGNHSPLKSFYIHRNHYYNIIKNLPFPFLLQALLLLPMRYILLLTSVARGRGPSAALAAKPKTRWQDRVPFIVMRSWWQVLTALPWLIRERAWIQSQRQVPLATIHLWFTHYCAPWRTIIYGPTHSRTLQTPDLDARQD